ncbi:MAG: patatin-like phospholipase family protein [Burkholderiales bacterium]|nr:patatin-like phospholipase family protein [Burkholderiales bacterium]
MRGGRSFTVHAGARAAAQLRAHGLAAADVGCVPAAAGGPKGLALIPLDRRLFDPARGWLRGASLELVGASIGAWRMAAAAMREPLAALDRLAAAYVGQTYSHRPSPREVAEQCRRLARAVLGDARSVDAPPGRALTVVTARARGALERDATRGAFARAALVNTLSRSRLAAHLQRVVFTAGSPRLLSDPFDAFGLDLVALDGRNCEDALLASGSIPLLCEPVRSPEGAPRGQYWDGGLIDYHLLLPYSRLPKLVLYPHFAPSVTAGWLDKFLPWRRHARAHPWLANVLVVAPSTAMLERLPNRKLPDRNDFYRYGLDHATRQRDWRRAMAESERFADEVMAWLERPDPSLLRPL